MHNSPEDDCLQSVLAQLQDVLSVPPIGASGSPAPNLPIPDWPTPDLATVDGAELDITALEALYQRLLQAFDARQFSLAKQPYVTEFHKQLRLLGTDIAFLKLARQPATVTQRLTTIRDRLQALQGYHGAMTGQQELK